ncbi:hypothetical protein [Streptomyces angustmyceticus]|uniref:hypothetical protein n=1 Tax=Streptomyces angustmyceticus TaxID=285578 RepID=UPI000A392375|nr:hypothetical protein [Streptomyces angustmyceticus]
MSLQRLLGSVGPAVLSGVCAPRGTAVPVGDVVIAEPDGGFDLRPGDLVLGVNLTDRAQALRLLSACAERSAGALLLKAPAAVDESVVTAASAAGLPLVQVEQQAGWAQVVSLLRAVLDSESHADSGTRAVGAEAGDLFGLADAIAAVIDAPVTIEDRSSRVLAYSARQERGDEARVATIMGRHVPDDVNAHFRRHGVFHRIAQDTGPIYVPAVVEGTKPRLVMPVHAGGDVLGSIWAIVPGPVAAERAAAFADIPFDTGAPKGRGKGKVAVTVDPATTGTNALNALVRTPDGGVAVVPELKVTLTLPGKGLGPLPVKMKKIGGYWAAEDFEIPFPGKWKVTVTVRTSDTEQDTETAPLEIG